MVRLLGLSSHPNAPNAESESSRPVPLGSATGCIVRRPHRLLWPHPRFWRSAAAYGFVHSVCQRQNFPNLLCLSVGMCRLPYPGGSDDFIQLFIRHRCCFHPLERDSTTALSGQSGPACPLTRLQSSLYATAHTLVCPARSGLLLPSFHHRMSPSGSVGYRYVSNSQFSRLVFHQLDKQPYGLQP